MVHRVPPPCSAAIIMADCVPGSRLPIPLSRPLVPTSVRSANLTARQLYAILACLVAGSVLRLIWPADMEWKGDEQWMVSHAIAIARHGPLPWVGMPSGAGGPNHPAFGVWLFVFFARWTSDPVGMVQWVQWLNVAALWGWAAFAWRCIPAERRVSWLWGIAIFAVSPVPILLARKLWAPDLLPLVGMPLLWAHYYRRHPTGAFAWGVLGALIGQIHLSGFFFAFALLLVTALRASARAGMTTRAWAAWIAGSVIGALPLIPWALALDAGGSRSAHVAVRQLVAGTFFSDWFLNAWGLHLSYSSHSFFIRLLEYPWVAGRPTYAMGVAQLTLALVGVYATGRWILRRFHLGLDDPTLSLYLTVALVTGVLMTLAAVKVRVHYLIVLWPFVHIWAAALLHRRVRLLTLVAGLQLVVSATYLGVVHVRGGIPEGDYGVSYRASSRP